MPSSKQAMSPQLRSQYTTYQQTHAQTNNNTTNKHTNSIIVKKKRKKVNRTHTHQDNTLTLTPTTTKMQHWLCLEWGDTHSHTNLVSLTFRSVPFFVLLPCFFGRSPS